ncbi:hypothetical protein KR059_001024, partial [Drosophila kikkawai]
LQFSGPGSIPNAVQQYNVLRGAELAEMRRRKERTTATSVFPVFCKVRCPGSDVNSMVTSRDVDVVTQLSLDSQTSITNEDHDHDDSADVDIKCAMGDLMRLCGGAESPPKTRVKGKGKPKASKINSTAKRSRKVPQQQQHHYQNGDFLDRLKNLHLEVCAELQTLVDEEVKKPSPSPSPRVKRVPRKLKKPNTQRQEGGGPPQNRSKTQEPSPRIVDRVFYEDYFLPQPKWVDIIPSAVMSQGIKVNVCTCPAATQQSAYKFMEQYGSIEPESLTPFFQEDSDLDHEFADRKGYLRYVEPRPRLNNDETPGNAEHGIVDPSQPLAAKPCFVELERRPHQLSLLRSLSPMRYTSQCSELAQKPDSLAKSLPQARKAAMEKGRPRKAKIPRSITARSKPVSKLKATSANGRLPAGSQPEGRVLLNTLKDPAPPPPPTPAPQPAQVTMPKRHQKRRKPSPVVVYSKSLDDLKSEKQRIYNKISFTHERIIGALDKLQISLLQLPPARQRSVQEQEKRKRNAFEFCVRFARNFLYPLKGMIDDVRLTSVANFNSAISNEACHRVMCVYGLMLQSIQTYQRQLRYFLLEKVAQKLSALIEMIYTMTNCCLDKNILARHDPVVESLLERCTRFLSFIEDMQEERCKLARETLRRRHIHPLQLGHVQVSPRVRSRRSHFQQSPRPTLALRLSKQEKFRSHKRYDLKMCLNDFKVYEPRVVPKERPRPNDKIFRRRRRNSQVTGTPVADPPSELHPVKDNIQTQMQIQAATEGGGGEDSTSTLSLTTTTTTAENQGNWASREREPFPLREAMLEAVRRATRSQLQEVLDPMMRSLKAVVNQKMSKMG